MALAPNCRRKLPRCKDQRQNPLPESRLFHDAGLRLYPRAAGMMKNVEGTVFRYHLRPTPSKDVWELHLSPARQVLAQENGDGEVEWQVPGNCLRRSRTGRAQGARSTRRRRGRFRASNRSASAGRRIVLTHRRSQNCRRRRIEIRADRHREGYAVTPLSIAEQSATPGGIRYRSRRRFRGSRCRRNIWRQSHRRIEQ